MKILTKEEDEAHTRVVLRGGAIGGTVGLGLGLAGVALASRRWQAFANLTLPFRAFLVSSTATFAAVTVAERRSIAFGRAQNPMSGYHDSRGGRWTRRGAASRTARVPLSGPATTATPLSPRRGLRLLPWLSPLSAATST